MMLCTHTCGELRESHAGAEVAICGATNANVEMFLCTSSLLPIVVISSWASNDFDPERYDEDVDSYFGGGIESDCCAHWGEPEGSKVHYFSALMKRYGGKNWRGYCTRTFDPFDAKCAHPSAAEWDKFRTFASYFRGWRP